MLLKYTVLENTSIQSKASLYPWLDKTQKPHTTVVESLGKTAASKIIMHYESFTFCSRGKKTYYTTQMKFVMLITKNPTTELKFLISMSHSALG